MNNQDKNTYVKQQITTTLLELLKEKELSDINIGEITKKAQVSRNSFYRNYADKEDIRDTAQILWPIAWLTLFFLFYVY